MASKYFDHGNYVEIVVCDGDVYDLPDARFFRFLQIVKQRGGASFQKHYKEYVHRNMFYENSDKNQVKVYKKTLTLVDDEHANNMRVLVFHREKLPFHAFPSTMGLHSVAYVSKVVFKVNNRVFINFERRRYEDAPDTAFNKVYINYNHEENVDGVSMEAVIKDCVALLSR